MVKSINFLQKPKARPRRGRQLQTAQQIEGKEKFVVELPYDFEHGDRPNLSKEEHQGVASLRHIFPAILNGVPELNAANRDDLFPAYYAYRMGSLSGTVYDV